MSDDTPTLRFRKPLALQPPPPKDPPVKEDVLTQLLGSKKFLAFIATALVVVLSPIVGLFGYEVDPEKLALLVGAAATYILSQGIADHGATAAKINADSVASMDPVVPRDTLAKDEPMAVEVVHP